MFRFCLGATLLASLTGCPKNEAPSPIEDEGVPAPDPVPDPAPPDPMPDPVPEPTPDPTPPG